MDANTVENETTNAGQVTMLPQSLEAATKRMMSPDSIARQVLGDAFIDHFGGTREHEVKVWNEAVTNWEGKATPSLTYALY